MFKNGFGSLMVGNEQCKGREFIDGENWREKNKWLRSWFKSTTTVTKL